MNDCHNTRPTVAVAIITRHRPAILRECLKHVRAQTVTPDEVLVVDSSEDHLSQDVARDFPEVTFVRFRDGKNQMPASRNLALLHSHSEVIAYVDDDSLADPDWLEQLLDTYVRYPEIAGVGGRVTDKRWIYDPDSPIGRVDSLGTVISNFFGDPGCVPEVDILPGCNMSFRRSALEAVGGVDPNFVCTNHREDPDVCLRIRKNGGLLRYQPAAHAIHLNARNSLGELRPWHEFFFRYSFARNDTYFVIKHFGANPRAVLRIMVTDTIRFLGYAQRSRSPVVLATIPVCFFAKAVGFVAGYVRRLADFAGDRPNYFRGLDKTACQVVLRQPPLPESTSVAVAVITRNRPTILRQCLEHLREQTVVPSEVVVVDSSANSESQLVCRDYPEVSYIRFENGRHQMPKARNLALVNSRSEVIAYIDDDCLVDSDWLERLLDAYRTHPECAGVGGRITDERWTFDPATAIGKVDDLGRVTSNFFGDPGCVPEVDVLPGGNMSFRREAIEAVGGVDPGYVGTNHREDPDLCLRIRENGSSIRYQPDAHALHLNARNSLSELRPWHEFFLRYSFARNDTYFVIKHFGNRGRAVWRTLIAESFDFLRRAANSKSLTVLATVPVYFWAKLIGLAAGYLFRFRIQFGTPPSYLDQAARESRSPQSSFEGRMVDSRETV